MDRSVDTLTSGEHLSTGDTPDTSRLRVLFVEVDDALASGAITPDQARVRYREIATGVLAAEPGDGAAERMRAD